MPDTCPRCGRPLDLHDQHFRFKFPDPVLEVPADARAARTWGNDILLHVQGVGAFVRVLLPVRLTDDHTVTFGTWLGVSPDDLRAVWEQPKYVSLELNGHLANAIPPWGGVVLAQPASARVIDEDALPYVTESDGDALRVVLGREWPHDETLGAIDVGTSST